jgi:SAM-dependent methyltransferase
MTEKHFYEHFQKDQPTRSGQRLTAALARRIFEFARIKAHDKVMEIGPGRGAIGEICLEKGLEYFAIEPNREMAAALEEKGAKVTCAMVPPLPPLDRDFDIVLMIHVMEHMNSMYDALQITRQIGQVLRPKGRLIICSPDYLNLRSNFFNCDFSHNYVTTRRRLEQLLVNAGFTNIKSCYLSGPLAGLPSILVSALAAWMPFGLLNAMFASNKPIHKLYKLQLTFSRAVLIAAEKAD